MPGLTTQRDGLIRGNSSLREPALVAGTGDTGISQAFTKLLKTCLDELVADQRGVRGGKVEAVHHMRVTVRRLQSALAMFGDATTDEIDALKDKCDWLIDELGLAREIDVFSEEVLQPLLTSSDTPPVVYWVHKICLAERRKAYRRANSALSSVKFGSFLSGLRQMVASANGFVVHQENAKDAVSRALDTARRELKVKKKFKELSRSRLHKLRLRSKRMRYSVEIARGLIGKRERRVKLRNLLKRLSELQSSLGSINDLCVHEVMLRKLIEQRAGSKRRATSGFVRKQIKIFLPEEKRRRRKLMRKAQKSYDAIIDAGKCWA